MLLDKLHGIYKALLNSVDTHQARGILHVKGEACVCKYASEFGGEIADKMEELLEQNPTFFYVVEEKDQQLHVLAYPKDTVYRAVASIAATEVDSGGGKSGTDDTTDTGT